MATHYRAIWISDVHLGTRGCKAEILLDFFRHTESQYLYLIGDIVDGWRLRRSWFWRQSHNDVIQKILRKGRKGTRVVYVPGNHDECMRLFTEFSFGAITLQDDAAHVTADGRKLLILHGDTFDGVVRYAKWLALMGDFAYEAMMAANVVYNRARRMLGFPYWSLAGYLKSTVKNAVQFISNYREAVVHEARRRGFDGVVCGHIHAAEITEVDGVLYCNDGDWVESCTALVEHHDGRLELLRWAETRQLSLF